MKPSLSKILGSPNYGSLNYQLGTVHTFHLWTSWSPSEAAVKCNLKGTVTLLLILSEWIPSFQSASRIVECWRGHQTEITVAEFGFDSLLSFSGLGNGPSLLNQFASWFDTVLLQTRKSVSESKADSVENSLLAQSYSVHWYPFNWYFAIVILSHFFLTRTVSEGFLSIQRSNLENIRLYALDQKAPICVTGGCIGNQNTSTFHKH